MLKEKIEIIKDRLSVSAIVGQKVRLKKSAGRFIGLCPFHQEKTPSFSVNDTERFFHCFGCGKHGDIIDFVSETENLEFIEALKKLAKIAGIEITEKQDCISKDLQDFLENLNEWFKLNLQSKNGKLAKNYIENRINKETISSFELGYCPNGLSDFFAKKKVLQSTLKNSGILDRSGRCYFTNRITFPIRNKQNKLIAFGSRSIDGFGPKYINSAENILFKKSETLYSINNASKFYKSEVIIAEGYMDVIRLFEHGYKNTVGLLGTSITEFHLKIIFDTFKGAIFCFDGDKAGIAAAKKSIDLILKCFLHDVSDSIKFVFLPQGFDPDDLLSKNPTIFKSLLQNAKTISQSIFFLCADSKTFKTPEDFICLEQELFSYINGVKDSAAKSHFKAFFKNKVFELKRKKNLKSYSTDIKIIAGSAKTNNSETLLQLALKFPQILQSAQNEECFCMLYFSDQNLKSLHQFAIDFLNDHPQKLSKENLDLFFSSNPSLHSFLHCFLLDGVARYINSQEYAIKLWNKIVKKDEDQMLKTEYKELIQSQALDEEKMQKAQAILMQIRKQEV